ncbi:MAG TPA: 50S ribosomal protein L30 [bacterium]|jgi:large subunit ribosomal protein L30|nr:50S ribosomal protein L30 [bacterium]HNT65354.1 50S ribosomal protein L30 [bacterium]HOX86522.1 50S ribosomal protein L30 [bacterium]HPG46548.1 50S ribosomal protein L30 [bacterium]HPM98396.1 50S ribosomal protein L30 [bacterium]
MTAKKKVKEIRITLIKSTIGCLAKQKATAKALGFHKMHSSVVHGDTPVIRGMINCISHLVKVEDVK